MMLSLLMLVMMGLYHWIDRPLAYWVSTHQIAWVSAILRGCAIFGESSLWIAGLSVMILIGRLFQRYSKYRPYCAFLLSCLILSNTIALVLKMCLGRARPMLWLDEGLYGFFGFHTQSSYWSFPSGHATTWMSLAYGLSFLYPRATMVSMMTVGCLAITRILLLKHYASDVVVAIGLVAIELWLVGPWLWSRIQREKI